MRYYYSKINDPFDLLFNDVFDTWTKSGRKFPPADVRETDKEYVIDLEVAGYPESSLSLNIDKKVLTIKGDEVKAAEGEYIAREILTPSFERSFALPDGVDEEKIGANYANGVLTVTIPKTPKAEPRRIEVKIGK